MTQRTAAGTALLWFLAAAAIPLLIYEAWTLAGAVLGPLLNNPQVLQTDFHYYYDAAVRFTRDRQLLYRMSDDVIAGFAYPPPAIVPFMALARLPLGIALLLLTIASYLALAIAMVQWFAYLGRHGAVADRPVKIAIVLIALASGPVYMNAVFGQVNAFVLASAVAFVTMAEAMPILAGVALAAGIALKIYPIVAGAMVLWNRRVLRALLWAAIGGAVIMIAAWPLVPVAAYRTFLTEVLPARIDQTALHITNQSLVAFLERFRTPSELFLNWTGHEAVTVGPLERGINILAIGLAIGLFWKRRGTPPAGAAGLIALVAVIAPLGWGHTYVMVLPLVMLQLINMTGARPLAAIAIFVAVGALMIPAGRHLPIDGAPDWLENVVYSRYLLATVALLCLTPGGNRRTQGDTGGGNA